MLPNISPTFYHEFKKTYRIKKFTASPATTVSEIVNLGYLDVNRTLRGITSTQRMSFKQAVVSFVQRILSNPPANQQEFDDLHDQCCLNCLAISSPGNAEIRYGQAQKLINMSLKYLYNEFAAFYPNQNLLSFPSNNIEHFFHLPIDGQILGCLVKKNGFTNPGSWQWSQWTYTEYIQFQNQLRARISTSYKPLEIDYLAWNKKGASLSAINPP